jgi:CRP-like cAMP-binding protein
MDEKRLKTVPLFESLSKQERKQVAHWADEVDISEGRHLADQGDFSYEFFVIEQGSAEVLRDGKHLADLGPGDFVGEMGLLAHTTRNATVVAKSPIVAVVMTGRDFREMAREMPEVAAKIQAAVEERSRALVG